MSAALTPAEEIGTFIAVLASVGMTQAHVTVLSLDRGEIDGKRRGGTKVDFRPSMGTADLRAHLPEIIADADRHECSVVLSHPLTPRIKLIQLDDVRADLLQQLRGISFMQLQTSENRFQAWVAMREEKAASGDYFRRLRKGVGCDQSASGATRSPGSKNYKAKYGPQYPMIRLVYIAPNRIATVAEIEETRLLAEPTPVAPQRVMAPRLPSTPAAQQWPDYAECYAYGIARGDRDQGDLRFAQIAAWRGFSVDAVESEILRLSPKCAEQNDPERYALRKAEYGAELAAKYPNPTPFQGARTPQNGRHGSDCPEILPLPSNARHGLAAASSVAAAPTSPEAAQPHAPGAASSEPCLDGIFVVGDARQSRVIAFCSTREDAAAVFAASGIPAVFLGATVPVRLRARTALKRVLVATRSDTAGESLARRIIQICSLASLRYVPIPANGASEETLRLLLGTDQVRSLELSSSVARIDDGLSLLDYAVERLGIAV